MNDNSKNEEFIDLQVSLLAEYTRFYSTSQLSEELNVLVQRINFMPAAFQSSDNSDDDRATIEAIEKVLSEDISEGLQQYVWYLFQHKHLNILKNPQAQAFLAYCEKYFFRAPEVTFISAVQLTRDQKKQISESIKDFYPDNARLLFNMNPTIIAGFVIRDHTGQVNDYSLRGKGIGMIKKYLVDNRLYG